MHVEGTTTAIRLVCLLPGHREHREESRASAQGRVPVLIRSRNKHAKMFKCNGDTEDLCQAAALALHNDITVRSSTSSWSQARRRKSINNHSQALQVVQTFPNNLAGMPYKSIGSLRFFLAALLSFSFAVLRARQCTMHQHQDYQRVPDVKCGSPQGPNFALSFVPRSVQVPGSIETPRLVLGALRELDQVIQPYINKTVGFCSRAQGKQIVSGVAGHRYGGASHQSNVTERCHFRLCRWWPSSDLTLERLGILGDHAICNRLDSCNRNESMHERSHNQRTPNTGAGSMQPCIDLQSNSGDQSVGTRLS